MGIQIRGITERHEVINLTRNMARIAERLVGIASEFERMGLDAEEQSTLEPYIRKPGSRGSKKIMKLLRESADLMQRGERIQNRLTELGVRLTPEETPEQPSAEGVEV